MGISSVVVVVVVGTGDTQLYRIMPRGLGRSTIGSRTARGTSALRRAAFDINNQSCAPHVKINVPAHGTQRFDQKSFSISHFGIRLNLHTMRVVPHKKKSESSILTTLFGLFFRMVELLAHNDEMAVFQQPEKIHFNVFNVNVMRPLKMYSPLFTCRVCLERARCP